MTADGVDVEAIFSEALQRIPGPERDAWLREATRDNLALYERVSQLLESHHRSSGFLEEPAFSDPFAQSLSRRRSILKPSSDPRFIGWLGQYPVLEMIGQGGMSMVYKALDPRLHKVIALKLLAPQLAVDEEAALRFMREARAMAQIDSDHVIDLFAVEEHEGIPLLVMEYFDSTSLQQLITQRHSFSAAEILFIAKQVALALEAAHEKGFIHRDVKPSNVLLSRDGKRIKLTDFGLVYSVEDERLSRTGQVSGTPLYMSPEQASGAAVDSRSDLFSLGSLLYTCCSLEAPFQASTVNAVMRNVCDQKLESPAKHRDDLPDSIVKLIQHLQEKSPAARPTSATIVVETIQSICRELHWNLDDPRSINTAVIKAKSGKGYGWRSWAAGLIVIAVTLSLFSIYHRQVNAPADQRSPPSKSPSITENKARPDVIRLPYTQQEALALQQQWSNYLNIPVERTNPLGMKLVLIPPGEFQLGSDENKLREIQSQHDKGGLLNRELFNNLYSEAPARLVRVTRPFYLASTEVTVGQFRKFVDATNYKTDAEKNGLGGVSRSVGLERRQTPEILWHSPGYDVTDQHPVTQVTWDDCVAFCRWLSEVEGIGYELPTEAQWELGCRAGFDGFNPPQSEVETQSWNNFRESIIPKKVARLKPNGFGLYDTLGNVQEWCQDWFEIKPKPSPLVVMNPSGPESGETHLLKGGNFGDPAWSIRPGTRVPPRASDPCSDRYGFRVMCTAEFSK